MQLKSFCGQPGVARCLHIPISSIAQMTTSSKFPVSIFKFSLIQTGLWRMMRSGGSTLTLTVPVSSHHKDNIMKSSTSPDAFMGLLTYAERNYQITLSIRNQGSSSNFRYSNLFHFQFSTQLTSSTFGFIYWNTFNSTHIRRTFPNISPQSTEPTIYIYKCP